MKKAKQDAYYLAKEGDAFFDRNVSGLDLSELRPNKVGILAELDECGIRPRNVLEYGCNIGDLLAQYAKRDGCENAVGIEVSQKAIDKGRDLFGSSVRFELGSMSDNPINDDPAFSGYFDLVVVDDVFCWVSRETLLQSIANVDDVLAEGGYLYVRDFYPKEAVANRNHHAKDEDVFCYKVPGSHASILAATRMYEVVSQKIFDDRVRNLSKFDSDRQFEQRWVDTIFRKSAMGYYAIGTR